ncbi:RNA polymerase sigma factor [Paraliomyxa miuraensis]|uniref:RNA polymerase sigma factor n=1 Tax=Paraliomyxa miuraensis TaxID=376150 RepID=UPI00225C2EE7|nr:sigma-70 family RNA polymerase sigma factor [Paraliomyxa miuraensis]MCX4239427.1 sigma-70 family RNA polymerase sigma factor [Paraliomyxa miuraensis]
MAPFDHTPPEPTLDEELLRRWHAGDQAAGVELFERHYDTLARFFCNKAHQPEDLIQKTFLACVEHPHRFRGEANASFKTYVVSIANNVLRNYYRDLNGPRNHAALPSTSAADPAASPSAIICEHEEEKLLLAALRSLPLDLQVLLELHYWEGSTMREMANVLGLSMAQVKNGLRKGRLELQKQLARLASSRRVLESTLTQLDDWAAGLRDKSHKAGNGGE